MKKPVIQPVDKRAELELAQLYHGLAKDAFRVAQRQYKYSRMAYNEKRFSDEDRKHAVRRGLTMSVLDDDHESDICREFSKHRKALADLYHHLGVKYNQQADIHMKLAGRR